MIKYWAAVILIVVGVCGAAAVENKGAEIISLDGGSRGAVSFPHQRHQNALGDCNVCHALFPQEPGAIVRLKQEGITGRQASDEQVLHPLPQGREKGR